MVHVKQATPTLDSHTNNTRIQGKFSPELDYVATCSEKWHLYGVT